MSQPKGEMEGDEDVDLDVEVDDEDMVKSNDDVVLTRKERVYWNWKRRKKLR
ncbi:MAG: hypothetical protein GY820_33090 [Gammaproteobacteria bacterium]|nr:hypothetical protein [Gammaproteobacteria bacterium]